jgi:molybdopterin-biosynthesis enzyme MoeA-like protein
MNSNSPGFGILIIGDEILSGRRSDKHMVKAIEILARHGQQLSWARYAGDDEARLVQHFREIKRTGDICFSFGGIGATVDDRTRQAVAKACQCELTRHPDAVQEIEGQFGTQAYPNRILMADLPLGAEIIPNPYNRIPGFSMELIHCLPGFPQMAWPMMEWLLETKYRHIDKTETVQHSFILQGAHESDLIVLLEQFQKDHPQVKISSLPSLADKGQRQIELGVQGSEQEAGRASDSLKTILLERGFMLSS